MGLDDRDYMRERYRQRQGLSPGKTQWNDRKARVEMAHDQHQKAVPLGSASWVGKLAAASGGWFSAKNRGFDYRKDRWRPARQAGSHPAQNWILALSAMLALIPMYREAKRHGWFPDLEPSIAFPSSGSVTVSRSVDPRTATAKLRVRTQDANAVIQLYEPESDRHVISVYVGRNDDVTVPVPPGVYRLQIVEGNKWHGPTRYFGSSTTSDTAVAMMRFERRVIHGIDLHRRPDGNLATRANFSNPKPLD